jgi:hypothetical protein
MKLWCVTLAQLNIWCCNYMVIYLRNIRNFKCFFVEIKTAECYRCNISVYISVDNWRSNWVRHVTFCTRTDLRYFFNLCETFFWNKILQAWWQCVSLTIYIYIYIYIYDMCVCVCVCVINSTYVVSIYSNKFVDLTMVIIIIIIIIIFWALFTITATSKIEIIICFGIKSIYTPA